MIIYKYAIKDLFIENLPKDFVFLKAELQRGRPYMWVMFDETKPTAPIKFFLYPTGSKFELGNDKYLGTFQQGILVWHLFYEDN